MCKEAIILSGFWTSLFHGTEHRNNLICTDVSTPVEAFDLQNSVFAWTKLTKQGLKRVGDSLISD